jgi:DNA-binding CsgD family transcriptional regulator
MLALNRPGQELSPRHRDTVALLAAGLSSKEIARALGISPRTAEAHIVAIRVRLGAKTNAQAVAIAIRDGIVG